MSSLKLKLIKGIASTGKPDNLVTIDRNLAEDAINVLIKPNGLIEVEFIGKYSKDNIAAIKTLAQIIENIS